VSGLHPGQLSFLLRAASGTLPSTMNLRRWNIQCSVKCILYDYSCPTTAHVLSACPIALSKDVYAYRHDLVLQLLVSSIAEIFVNLLFIHVYADLPNFRASELPPSIIPPNVIVTPFRPYIIITNTITSSLLLFELICPLDSTHHLDLTSKKHLSTIKYNHN